jgi:transposase-like protein
MPDLITPEAGKSRENFFAEILREFFQRGVIPIIGNHGGCRKQKRSIMKNSGSLAKLLNVGSFALAIALVTAFTATASAQEKGATKLLQSKSTQTVASETAAMSCPQCKDSLVTVVEKPTKTGAKAVTSTVVRHECPGCKHTFTTTGHGKAKVTSLTQSCKLDGGKDATCCAMK